MQPLCSACKHLLRKTTVDLRIDGCLHAQQRRQIRAQEPSPEPHNRSVASPVEENARASEAAWNPAVLRALQHVERLPESDSTDEIEAIPASHRADLDRCRPNLLPLFCSHWNMRVASCYICEFSGNLVDASEGLFSGRQRPVEHFTPCRMLFVVGCHLHASAALRSPIEKSIELVAFEDVWFSSMNFLEGREGAERYLLPRLVTPFIERRAFEPWEPICNTDRIRGTPDYTTYVFAVSRFTEASQAGVEDAAGTIP